MPKTIYLTEIRRQNSENGLRLTWSDGHSALLGYNYVRGYCPCASCQGHGSLQIVFHEPQQPVHPERIEPVGNYAISIVWSDHHATGIYRFDFLRDICPCPQCTANRGTA